MRRKYFKNSEINVIIPASGEVVNNILPISSEIHNTLLPVNGKPIIGWILDWLYEQNINNYFISLGPRKEKIIKYLDRIYSEKVNIKYCFPDKYCGLAYTIFHNIKNIKNKKHIFSR